MMYIRKLPPEDLNEALALIWDVFCEFDAPCFEPEGIRVFQDFIGLDSMEKMVDSKVLTFTGAYTEEKLVGVLAMRGPVHISLLFVDPEYHRRGVARSLFGEAIKETPREDHCLITVNSSPYGVPFYRRLGFVVLEPEKEANGMRFTPMRYDSAPDHADG